MRSSETLRDVFQETGWQRVGDNQKAGGADARFNQGRLIPRGHVKSGMWKEEGKRGEGTE